MSREIPKKFFKFQKAKNVKQLKKLLDELPDELPVAIGDNNVIQIKICGEETDQYLWLTEPE